MCKNDILFANRLQNYTFLRTQPNKMHKNSRNVHTSAVLCNEYVTNIRLFLVVGVMRVVCSEVQTTTLLALQRPTSDEITHVDHVAQFADVATGLDAFEQAFRLLVKHIQTVPGSMQAQVGANDAHIVRHNLVDLLDRLGDEHLLFVGHRTLIVPFRHALVIVVLVNMLQGVASSCLGIDHSLDERVGSQTVATMQTSARAFTDGIKALDT